MVGMVAFRVGLELPQKWARLRRTINVRADDVTARKPGGGWWQVRVSLVI